jgi:DNA transposition AAA+ family ATPase
MSEPTNERPEHKPSPFVVTKGYRLFAEMCDACRQDRSVGLGFGPAGTGKTLSATFYAHWNTIKPFLPEPLITYTGRSAMDGLYPYRPFTFASAPLQAPVLESRTVFYTPSPSASASPGRIEKEVMTLFAAYSYLAEAAQQRHHPSEEFVVTRRYSSLIELLIVDETNRLKDVGLEQIRDIADRGEIGLLLLGMPGLDKRLQRVPQLYSRVGFAQKIEPMSQEETRFFLAQRWSHRVSPHSTDFTDQEAVAAIMRITQGNLRLIDRLMKQVERVLTANQLTVVTKEVVETARQNLIIGFE